MTGKTSLLNQLGADVCFDLLDPQVEIAFRTRPHEFWEAISFLKPNMVVMVDEIQKIPKLLDYVQMGIDRKKIRFFLSGSSARKLRHGGANLLGGRAIYFNLHPLTAHELGKDFNINTILRFGSLPLISSLIVQNHSKEAISHLKSYVTTYIKEEIKAESLVRKLDSFYRFLDVAVQCNGQMIEFANVSRECAVHVNTVKEHYSILEDTLMGQFIWPFNRSERKKARPKFYFFDCGVIRALQNRLSDKPTSVEKGMLFETWIANELIRIRDYSEYEHRISLWRKGRWEIDFIIESGGKPLIAIECKTGRQIKNIHSLKAFQKDFPGIPIVICSLSDKRTRKLDKNIWIEPYRKTINRYRELSFRPLL